MPLSRLVFCGNHKIPNFLSSTTTQTQHPSRSFLCNTQRTHFKTRPPVLTYSVCRKYQSYFLHWLRTRSFLSLRADHCNGKNNPRSTLFVSPFCTSLLPSYCASGKCCFPLSLSAPLTHALSSPVRNLVRGSCLEAGRRCCLFCIFCPLPHLHSHSARGLLDL